MEEKLIDRIGDEYLNPNFQDGQILLNSDINEIVSIVKEGINANFNDIQKIQNGSHQVGNSKQLDGADLSRFSDGEMVGSDKLIPTSQQVKSYVDGKVQEIKDTTEVGKLVEDLNELSINVENKVDKEDLVNEETTGTDKAYNCDYINELFENGVGDSLPIGTIVEYTGENIPDGFEEVIEPENATVYVGPTEPTDGQDVWIQKSKNLLNLSSLTQATGGGITFTPKPSNNTINVSGTANAPYLYILLPRFKPESNFNIFLNGQQETVNNIVAGFTLYDAAGSEISDFENKYSFDITSQEYDYIKVWLKRGANKEMNVDMQVLITYDNDSTYEPYIEKAILTKNDNGAYEKIYKSSIVESGSNENGSWVKFADGTMECRNSVWLYNVICTTQIGNVFIHDKDGFKFPNFPVPFIERPQVEFSFEQNVTNNRIFGIMPTADMTKTTRPAVVYLWADTKHETPFDNAWFLLSYVAKGRWK